MRIAQHQSNPVYIVAPGGARTGGPELCHQLGDALNRQLVTARMLYTPFDREFDVPAEYRRYDVAPVNRAALEPHSTVVIPEFYPTLVNQFPGHRIMFWWQSVENFAGQRRRRSPARLVPRSVRIRRMFGLVRKNIDLHLYQSEYARLFLEGRQLSPRHPLSDYIADEFIEGDMNEGPRRDLILYNPRKGNDRNLVVADLIRHTVRPSPEIVPLTGFTRTELRQLMSSAKLYIDFGGHPGKDRLPREAAILGACVMTNRRGSAANPVDIPIPPEYKIDDCRMGFAADAAKQVERVLADFDAERPKFDAYRTVIRQQSIVFQREVDAIFASG